MGRDVLLAVHGTCDSRFSKVADLLRFHLNNGDELGAAISVNWKGKDVVDIWGGCMDRERTKLWTDNSIVNIWSSTKTVTSLAALMLIDRGLVSPTDRVAKHWPEFAANGKEDIEVRHILSHTSGLSGWDAKMTVPDIIDIPKATQLLADQKPWWQPGTQSGYHAITHGHLIGELVRRKTQKSLGQFIVDEIAKPLNADFTLGVKETDWHRVAEIIPPPLKDTRGKEKSVSRDSVKWRTLINPFIEAHIANTPLWRSAELGAANGHTNARGLNRIMSAITMSGLGLSNFLKKETVDLIFEEHMYKDDLVLGHPLRFGLGYGLPGRDLSCHWIPDGRVFYWGGWGGSMTVGDLDRKVTITYVMNKMENAGLGHERTRDYFAAIYEVLGVELPPFRL